MIKERSQITCPINHVQVAEEKHEDIAPPLKIVTYMHCVSLATASNSISKHST